MRRRHYLQQSRVRNPSGIRMPSIHPLHGINPDGFQTLLSVGKREENEKTWAEDERDEIDSREIFDLIKEIRDPEHPMSLEELG